MAEIKSTLDLVMEKTKNLSLSDEERREQKNKEIGSRIRGLLNKFKDEAISLDRFNSEYQVLKKVQEFQTVRATAARERRKILKEQLAKTHFIYGSAVVPNLEIDDKWRKESGQIKAEFETKLNRAKTKLLAE